MAIYQILVDTDSAMPGTAAEAPSPPSPTYGDGGPKPLAVSEPSFCRSADTNITNAINTLIVDIWILADGECYVQDKKIRQQ